MSSLSVRFRIDLSDECAVGPGKIALLEAIHRGGSLSQAARDLGMSYRRAWQLLENLNATFSKPVAKLLVGGRGGGGAQITPFGHRLIDAYRQFETHLERRARADFRAFLLAAHPKRRGPPAQRRPVNRRGATQHRLRRG